MIEENGLLPEFIEEAHLMLNKAQVLIIKITNQFAEKKSCDRKDIDNLFQCFHFITDTCGFLNLKNLSMIAKETHVLIDIWRENFQVTELDIGGHLFQVCEVLKNGFVSVAINMKDGITDRKARNIVGSLREKKELFCMRAIMYNQNIKRTVCFNEWEKYYTN